MQFTPKQRRGFTLFEVMMAMGIMVFLIGGTYFAVSTAVSSSIQLGEAQMDARQRTAVVRFLREGFLNLPAGARIYLRTRELGKRGRGVDLVIERAAGAFESGVLEKEGSGVVLGANPDGRGTYSFSIQRFISGQSEKERDRNLESGVPLKLVEGIGTVKWRFWDKMNQKFTESWDQPDERPEFVEFTFLTPTGDETTSVFRIPFVVSIGRSGAETKLPPKS